MAVRGGNGGVPLQTLRDVYNVKDPSRSLILISEDSPGGELYHNY